MCLFMLCNCCLELASKQTAWIVDSKNCRCIFLPVQEAA
jgi:hypothetical protein